MKKTFLFIIALFLSFQATLFSRDIISAHKQFKQIKHVLMPLLDECKKLVHEYSIEEDFQLKAFGGVYARVIPTLRSIEQSLDSVNNLDALTHDEKIKKYEEAVAKLQCMDLQLNIWIQWFKEHRYMFILSKGGCPVVTVIPSVDASHFGILPGGWIVKPTCCISNMSPCQAQFHGIRSFTAPAHKNSTEFDSTLLEPYYKPDGSLQFPTITTEKDTFEMRFINDDDTHLFLYAYDSHQRQVSRIEIAPDGIFYTIKLEIDADGSVVLGFN